jgi:hypothetical protein
MYLWDFKKKGVNVGSPRPKNTVSVLVLCCHYREMSAKSADIWLSGQHVANMLPTCHQHSQLRFTIRGLVGPYLAWNHPNPCFCKLCKVTQTFLFCPSCWQDCLSSPADLYALFSLPVFPNKLVRLYFLQLCWRSLIGPSSMHKIG